MRDRTIAQWRKILAAWLLLCPVWANALTLNTEPVQGRLVLGQTEPGAKVTLDGKAIKVTPEGAFAFGFGRDATGQHTLDAELSDRSHQQHRFTVQTRTFNVQRIKGIAKAIMHPAAKDVARAKKDAEQVWLARNKDSDLTAFANGFRWPLLGPITGVYGSQRVYNGEPRRPHYGVDIAAADGTQVVAPADGVVTLWVPDMFYSGGTMIIDHGYGVSSTFLHLSGALVKQGDKVKAGEPVALVGHSGRATGAHLDWRINWYHVRLDPQLLVPPMAEAQAATTTAK